MFDSLWNWRRQYFAASYAIEREFLTSESLRDRRARCALFDLGRFPHDREEVSRQSENPIELFEKEGNLSLSSFLFFGIFSDAFFSISWDATFI